MYKKNYGYNTNYGAGHWGQTTSSVPNNTRRVQGIPQTRIPKQILM